MKTLILFCIMLLNISVMKAYGQPKEEIYIRIYSAKAPTYVPLSFVIIDNAHEGMKKVSYDVFYSSKGNIKRIHKFRAPYREDVYRELENGNIRIEYQIGGYREFYSTNNFRETREYKVFSKKIPELFHLDNYEMLKYLDSHFTKYIGPEEYKHLPLLREQQK